MHEDPRFELLRRAYAAFNRRDVEAVLAAPASRAAAFSTRTGSGTARGTS